jgi:subtilisin family serine protease
VNVKRDEVMKRIFLSILFVLTTFFAFSQELISADESVQTRKRAIRQFLPDAEKKYAEEYARRNDIPVRLTYPSGRIIEIRRISEFGQPVYYTTHNLNAAKTTSTNKVWNGGGLGLDLDGSGIVVGVWDGGHVRKTHNEFEGRVRLLDNDDEFIFHATHVAGTIAAAGIRNNARGMAGSSTIDSYNWEDDDDEMKLAATNGMLISNHSYGYIHGWHYNEELERWEWYGVETISQTEDYNFGFYSQDTRKWDEIAYEYPFYLVVKSAGNDRGEEPAPGAEHFVWSESNWVKSTVVRNKDGGSGFDCIGTRATAKNILTVGAIDDMPDGYTGPADVRIASFSASGPTDDGRIKPDIVGNGINLFSAGSELDNAYGTSTGTSMSAPNVAGSLVLLQEHYKNWYGKYMFASVLKALAIHTADDAGNKGPDYRYGWGLMNTASAAEHISMKNGEMLLADTLMNGTSNGYTFYSTGEEEIKITLVWSDPPGPVPSPQLNPVDRILVNDLDIRLKRIVDGHVFKPFTLDPANPSRNAVPGDNKLDNVEQIVIETPVQGYYTLNVSWKRQPESGEQLYGLAVSGLSKEFNASGTIRKEKENGEILLTSAATYLNNTEVEWLIEPGNNMPVSLYFDYFGTESDTDVVRIYDGLERTDPLLAEFSGMLIDPDTVITSGDGKMLVVFVSNETIADKGFRARYCTVAPQGTTTIAGNEFPCRNSEMPFFALAEEGTEFAWESENMAEIKELNFNSIQLAVKDSADVLSVIPFNRCGEGQIAQLGIAPLSAPPVMESIIGDTVVCAGTHVEYETTGLNGSTYLWEAPDTWLGNSETSTISLISGNTPGDISVRGENACGAGESLTINIDLLDVPETENILTDKAPPCEESVQVFYVEPLPDHQYSWSVNDDWDILEGEDSDSVLIRVGNTANFVRVTTTNICGQNESGRLFLTAKLPELPEVELFEDDQGLTTLRVTNADKFDALQWYRDGIEIQGESGTGNPLIISRNGLYTVASISDKRCYNLLEDEDGIEIYKDEFEFIAYRVSETAIAIENSINNEANVHIYSVQGRLEFTGTVQPGYNEIVFPGKGVHLVRLSGYGGRQIIKSLF